MYVATKHITTEARHNNHAIYLSICAVAAVCVCAFFVNCCVFYVFQGTKQKKLKLPA